jgi:hypothetical protein
MKFKCPIISYIIIDDKKIVDGFSKSEMIESLFLFKGYLPNSFKVLLIDEISKDEFINCVTIQQKEYLRKFKYANKDVFCNEFNSFIHNEFSLIYDLDWSFENDINFESNIEYNFNTYFAYRHYEDQLIFLLIDNSVEYYLMYLDTILQWLSEFFTHDDKIVYSPFDEKSEKIFNYLIEEWKYKSDIKYAYIFNLLVDEFEYKILKPEYEKFIREKYNINRIYFGNAGSEKIENKLRELINIFLSK